MTVRISDVHRLKVPTPPPESFDAALPFEIASRARLVVVAFWFEVDVGDDVVELEGTVVDDVDDDDVDVATLVLVVTVAGVGTFGRIVVGAARRGAWSSSSRSVAQSLSWTRSTRGAAGTWSSWGGAARTGDWTTGAP